MFTVAGYPDVVILIAADIPVLMRWIVSAMNLFPCYGLGRKVST